MGLVIKDHAVMQGLRPHEVETSNVPTRVMEKGTTTLSELRVNEGFLQVDLEANSLETVDNGPGMSVGDDDIVTKHREV
jgi:hypothetical protein